MVPSRFSLAGEGAGEKLAKENAEEGDFALCGGRGGCAPSTAPPFEKGGRKLLAS